MCRIVIISLITINFSFLQNAFGQSKNNSLDNKSTIKNDSFSINSILKNSLEGLKSVKGSGSNSKSYTKSNPKVKVFQNKGNGISNDAVTWGYDIYLNGKPYIHQPNIPSVRGKQGFNSKSKARKAGEFICYKIKNGVVPPSVTFAELDSLGVLRK